MVTNYATNIALVDRENNTVFNVIWGVVYHEEEFNTDTQFTVLINDLNVTIGDTYDGERFYHDGEPVQSLAEQIADMKAALELLEVKADG